jgi:hypothetical protein
MPSFARCYPQAAWICTDLWSYVDPKGVNISIGGIVDSHKSDLWSARKNISPLSLKRDKKTKRTNKIKDSLFVQRTFGPYRALARWKFFCFSETAGNGLWICWASTNGDRRSHISITGRWLSDLYGSTILRWPLSLHSRPYDGGVLNPPSRVRYPQADWICTDLRSYVDPKGVNISIISTIVRRQGACNVKAVFNKNQ